MRKNSKSSRKSLSSKKRQTVKKPFCSKCNKNTLNPLSLHNSLYNKYSAAQIKYHHILLIDGLFKNKQLPKQLQQNIAEQEYLTKYHKKMSIKHTFPSIKQVYKQHRQIPRIFHVGIKQIFNKCYHRKRLLQYFKIAKILGIKVESVRFSTFLLSTNQTKKNYSKSFEPIITCISRFQFSQEIEKQLLEQLSQKQNISDISNVQNSQKKQFSTFFL